MGTEISEVEQQGIGPAGELLGYLESREDPPALTSKRSSQVFCEISYSKLFKDSDCKDLNNTKNAAFPHTLPCPLPTPGSVLSMPLPGACNFWTRRFRVSGFFCLASSSSVNIRFLALSFWSGRAEYPLLPSLM